MEPNVPEPPALPELPAPDVADGVTWHALVRHAEALLAAAGEPNAGNEARWIVEEASGADPHELAEVLATVARTAGVAAFQRMLGRRLAGEPLQYVLGHWPFRRLDLAVDPRVLIPRPETEVVAGVAIAEARDSRGSGGSGGSDRPVRVVDLGTGSGAIGLSVAAEVPDAVVWITDRSTDALAVAVANLAGMGPGASRVTAAAGDWFDALDEDLRGTIDVVVSNPPYIADHEVLDAVVDDWEPVGALRSGPLGTEAYRAIIEAAPTWLGRPGALVVEIAPGQADEVAALMAAAGAEAVDRGPDLAGRTRWVRGRWTA